jgi:hypothetical protein
MAESKSCRPDVRVEPTLCARLKEYCAKRGITIAAYTREFYVKDLMEKGVLTADDLRAMRGAGK